ncbi:hypothetical protein Leryth_012890 [Lithospermum erythrorhizon]|nr:hypothetical protein Leryth_012890 [Lithospermum erythrorhizon]
MSISPPPKPRHVVAIPYPGRGHINPLMNLCKQLISNYSTTRTQNLVITFVITEEWLGFIGSEAKPTNIQFATIPNVLPSELSRASDMVGFVRATQTKMAEPFGKVFEEVEKKMKVDFIIADSFMNWVIEFGARRNIMVASFWPMSAMVFTIFHHSHLLVQNGQYPLELSERGEELVDYIPGIPSIRLADIPTLFHIPDNSLLKLALNAISYVEMANFLLFPSIYELESSVIDALRQEFSFPVYTFGPLIPYFDMGKHNSKEDNEYLQWLDNQSPNSVLYVSLGSFLSVSEAQMDEIALGLRDSGVKYLWVARGDTPKLREKCGDTGIIVTWCEQLKVLCHGAIGGFWTHCGFSSTMESVFAGVPMLTLPILMDQTTNKKNVVQDWNIGLEVKRGEGVEKLVSCKDISQLIKTLMDSEGKERKKMLKRAKELQQVSQEAISEQGSSCNNLNAFLGDILDS